MFQKALLGLWTTCVLLTPHLASAATGDIVLYATDAANLHGNWSRVADPTAADGQRLASGENGWLNSGSPLESPADYVEFRFDAPALTPFHMWVRMRAGANSTDSDSVVTQFSDVVGLDGAIFYEIGTTNGLIVNLAADPTGSGLSGWGWQGGAYWVGQSTTLVFASGGSHTLRIQTREDGVSIDQVIFSPATYMANAPGPAANDATIVKKPGATGLPAPWSSRDIGSVGLAGQASFGGGLFSISGAGADIWGTADAFQFVSRSASGDAQIVARVASLQNVHAFAKAGVMFRDTFAAGSAHVLLDVRPNGAVEFMSRSATGGTTAYLAGSVQPPPAWLRLTRSGNTFTGEVSADGTAWVVVGSTSVALAATVSAGLIVSSHDTARLNLATFDHVAVTVPSVTPPSAPALPMPANTASGIALNSTVTWNAAGATSYDVNFGTTNPPGRVATNVTNPLYTPAAMLNGVQYFWQVAARNAAGTTMGPVWSFTTVAASSGSGAPTAYSAISDRTPYAKPALPQLGPAGFTFADPTFGSAMLRVTDGQTRPGMLNRSYRVPSNAHLNAWNANSTAFFVISNDGTVIPYAFNAATMTASRMQAVGTGNGGMTLGFYVEPQFSLVNPNVIYGVVSGGNNRTLSQYDFQTGVYSPLLDLDSVVGGLAGTYVGGIMTGGTPAENLLTFFGGTSQDYHYYALWAPIGNMGARKLLNTLTSTINGVSTNTPLNFHLHAMEIDRSGRFVFLYPTGPELGAPRYASQVYVWDTSSDAITAMTSGGPDGATVMHPAGHATAGYGVWVNQDCCTSSTWDAAQWQIRELTALAETRDLISPVQAVKEVYLADHTSWNNAQPSIRVPVISSTYRYGNNTAPWRAWDDEIIGIETIAGGGGNVWRFAHHRSNVTADNNPAGLYFWYQPIANVSPDGKWILFTSNWEKTLGTDAAEGTARQDVFLVRLTPDPSAIAMGGLSSPAEVISAPVPVLPSLPRQLTPVPPEASTPKPRPSTAAPLEIKPSLLRPPAAEPLKIKPSLPRQLTAAPPEASISTPRVAAPAPLEIRLALPPQVTSAPPTVSSPKPRRPTPSLSPSPISPSLPRRLTPSRARDQHVEAATPDISVAVGQALADSTTDDCPEVGTGKTPRPTSVPVEISPSSVGSDTLSTPDVAARVCEVVDDSGR
jgi:hypothetical protein